MKKNLLFLIAFIFSLSVNAQSPTLTFTNATGIGSITCSSPSINILASVNNTTVSPLTFSWAGPVSLSGTNVLIGTPGDYTVTAYNTANSFSITQTYSIGINVNSPPTTVNPNAQSITCAAGSAATFTGTTTNTLTNITQAWTSPFSTGSAVNSGTVSIYSVSGTGTFTYCVTNNINGCSTCKTVTVTSSAGFPMLTIASPTQFSLGCGSASVTSLNITNVVTSPVGSGTTFTVLPPSFVGPSYGLGGSTNYSATVPGQYTVIAHDNNNACETKVPISVISNTVGPNFNISAPTPTLTCTTPNVLLSSTNTNSAIIYSWSAPSFTAPVQSSTLSVSTTSAVTNTVVATYTLTGLNSANMCSSSHTMTIYQNTAPPTAFITPSNPILSCTTPSITLSNASTSNISPSFPHPQPVAAIAWYGPAPQPSVGNVSSYTAYTPGTYTLTVQDLNNGCTSSVTKNVINNSIYPVVSAPAPFNINCPAPTATIYPTVTGPSSGFTYLWAPPATASISSLTQPTVVVNTPGMYTITVTNTITSCATTTFVTVTVCAGIKQNSGSNVDILIYPNPTNGIFVLESNDLNTEQTIEIYSLLGVLVKTQAVIAGNTTINLQNEANGIYFIYIKEGKKAIKTAKIVKQ